MHRTFRINGTDHPVTIDPRDTLLDLLRDRLGLTGTKKGCLARSVRDAVER